MDRCTTAPLAQEEQWSLTNLPDELFQLEPTSDWGRGYVANMKVNGVDVLDSKGRRFKDFDFLPSQISEELEAFRIEMYTDRYHPRCNLKDLLIRMEPDPTYGLPDPHLFSEERRRFRNRMNIPCWNKKTPTPSLVDCLLYEQISWDSVLHNTCLPVTPAGFVKPFDPEESWTGTPVIIPLNRYLGSEQTHTPSDRLVKTYELIAKLQETARQKGYAHWIFLENSDKPASWREKAAHRQHPRSGPDDITVPSPDNMPQAGFDHIDRCIQDSVAKGEFKPSLDKLHEYTAAWVEHWMNDARKSAASSPVSFASSTSETIGAETSDETD